MRRAISIHYATSGEYKRQEASEILQSFEMPISSGSSCVAAELFSFEFQSVKTDEPLERDLETMVRHKVRSAYRKIMAPCIVEHAGLVLPPLAAANYPGGLTQPMWDALGAEGFVNSIQWAGEELIARAVVGYCDGLRIRTFVGETEGVLASSPRGGRKFYWDTVFVPKGGDGLTYAQMAEEEGGLRRKVMLSQSRKAMTAFLSYISGEKSSIFPDSRW
ncbi:MAG: non-canonical purine NTP pyrophosphatase [Haliea sp.]